MPINYSLGARVSNPNEENSPMLVYANAQYQEVINMEKLAAHISSHGSPFSKGTVQGLLTDCVSCIRENLLAGNKVTLGDLGSFYITLSSKGAESTEKFTVGLITKANVRWTPSNEFQSLLNEAEFRYVPTREKQAEARKEERESVDTKIGGPAEEDDNTGGGSDGSGEGLTD